MQQKFNSYKNSEFVQGNLLGQDYLLKQQMIETQQQQMAENRRLSRKVNALTKDVQCLKRIVLDLLSLSYEVESLRSENEWLKGYIDPP